MTRASVAIGGFRGARGRALARPRRAPRSRRALALTATATLGGVALLAWAGWWLLTSPTFAVARVESGPYRFSSRAAVDEVLRQSLGRNIWTLPIDDVVAAMAALPWVRTVHLQRRVPDTVAVEMTEWRPLASVAHAGRADEFVLVRDGRLLPWPEHLADPGLPVIVGLEPEAGDGSLRLRQEDAATIMSLLDALETTGLESVSPVDFIRVAPEGMVLELQQRAGRLVLGREAFDQRLSRYLLARDRVPVGARVDLRFAERVTFQPLTSETD